MDTLLAPDPTQKRSTHEHFDVVVVGAGLSGIGAGHHLQKHCPNKTYVILEGREAIGGTWDLFRYPGIRSDSDMYTLGYSFRPWTNPKAIADGPSILAYVRDTAREYGIDKHIRFNHRVTHASWSTPDACWTVEARRSDGATVRFTCNFLLLCAGYYRYEAGYTPDLPGLDQFRGRVIHPQLWADDVDYAGKRVVVIGSGATAVTLVPEMAKTAAHVTMLQRSPTYVVSRPSEDRIANWLRSKLPARLAYLLTRAKNVTLGMYFYKLARRKPERVKQGIIGLAQKALGPDFDMSHLTPRYNPWDQRLCLVPDGDLFNALREGRASIVTDGIESFTPDGIRLKSGKELPADLVVTATGLHMQPVGGMSLEVDGAPVDVSKALTYKGMMYSDVPNLASVFGYTNASWTLKADLSCEYVCRLINHMDRRGLRQCTPRRDASVEEAPLFDFTSGYIQRAAERLPKQGARAPWRLHQNYARDMVALRFGRVEDGAMEFSNPAGGAERRSGETPRVAAE